MQFQANPNVDKDTIVFISADGRIECIFRITDDFREKNELDRAEEKIYQEKERKREEEERKKEEEEREKDLRFE